MKMQLINGYWLTQEQTLLYKETIALFEIELR